MDEFSLIDSLIAELPASGGRVRVGPGDDAAVTEPGAQTATTVDALLEGVHFTLPEFSPAAVGRKALAAALSDLAAMGAEAGEAYVALGLSARLDEAFCIELIGGMRDLASQCGVELAGGDVSRAPVLILAMTAVGHQPAGAELVRRSGAGAGDAVVVTGELGGAATALRLLAGEVSVADEVGDALRARQLAPRPRLEAGLALAENGARAMIDISDGLGGDAVHLARASRVAIAIELERVPIQDGVEALAGGPEAALEVAASGGEDYELLACLPRERLADARAAVAATGVALTEIGSVSEGSGVTLRLPEGGELEPRGFDHLRVGGA